MAFYVVLFSLFAAGAIVSLWSLQGVRVFGVSASFLVAALSYFKGYVGTDTWSYVSLAENISAGLDENLAVEPGFVYLMRFALYITNDELTAVSLLATLAAMFSALAFSILPRVYAIPFIPIYVCYFLLDNSFNALRLGLAVGLCLIGAALYLRGRRVLPLLLVAVGCSFQFTVILLPSLFLAKEAWERRRVIAPLFILLPAAAAMYSARVEQKVALYSSQDDKGWAGLSMLLIAAALLTLSGLTFRNWALHGVLTLLIGVCVIPNEYGFLTIRLAQLIFLFLAFDLSVRVGREISSGRWGQHLKLAGLSSGLDAGFNVLADGRSLSASRAFILVLAVAASSIFRLRNVLDVSPEYLSPYVPYVMR